MSRSKGIGASEAWMLFDDVMTLYLRKKGIIEDQEESEAMWLGKEMETVIDKRYFKETGFMPEPIEPIIHPTETWRRCTPDRVVNKNGTRVLLEYKTTGIHADWGESGSDEIPFRVGTQVQWQLSLMPDIQLAEIPVYFFAPRREFVIYKVERNEEVINNLVEAGREFWQGHIEKSIPPPITGSDSSKRLLAHLYPRDVEDLFAADTSTEKYAEDLRFFESQRDHAISNVTLIQNRLKDIIGSHAGVVTSIGRVTWKRQKDRQVVDYKAIFDELVRDSAIGKGSAEVLIYKHTTTTPGPRVFRAWWKKED